MQNLPNPTYQTKPTKPTKPNPHNQTYQTKPTKVNLPNLPNQTYWSKQSTPGSVVPLAMFYIFISIFSITAFSDILDVSILWYPFKHFIKSGPRINKVGKPETTNGVAYPIWVRMILRVNPPPLRSVFHEFSLGCAKNACFFGPKTLF